MELFQVFHNLWMLICLSQLNGCVPCWIFGFGVGALCHQELHGIYIVAMFCRVHQDRLAAGAGLRGAISLSASLRVIRVPASRFAAWLPIVVVGGGADEVG